MQQTPRRVGVESAPVIRPPRTLRHARQNLFFSLTLSNCGPNSRRRPASAQLPRLSLAMFCARCFRSSVRWPATLLATRTYAVANPSLAKPPPPSIPPKLTPQLFSTPLTPAPAQAVKTPGAVVSGTVAGTPLRHINYLKGKTDPIALEDSEYPDWLWTLLASSKTAATADGEAVGDLYCEFYTSRPRTTPLPSNITPSQI